jgi:hypothetical protein
MEQLVNESGGGIIVDFQDPVQAAVQIKEYMSSTKAQNDCKTAREYIEKNMSSALCAEKYLDLLSQVTLKA